jgi:hypothetical protein
MVPSLGEQRMRSVNGARRTPAFAAALGVCVAAACARYAPMQPMRTRTSDGEMQFRHVRMAFKRDFVFDTRLSGAHTIRHAWLTVPTRDPCTGGAEVADIAIDGNAAAGGALPAGDHVLTVRFDNNQVDLSLDAVVDLGVDDDECWRVPVVSNSIGFEVENRWPLITGMNAFFTRDVRGMESIVDFRAGTGRWVGPFLLAAHLGIGPSQCNVTTCGKPDNRERYNGLALTATLEAKRAIYTHYAGEMTNSPFLGARYTAASVGLPALDGDRRFIVHLLQGVLSWGTWTDFKARIRYIERSYPLEIGVTIGALVDPTGPQRYAFVAGFDLRYVFQP